MIAILTDKASAGRDIARILGANGKGEGFLRGNGYVVTWASKRLVEPAPAEDYGQGLLPASSLPLIPECFRLAPAMERTAKGSFTDLHARKQLKVIERIFKQCKSIIVATSADGEGELRFRYIYSFLHCRKPFSRLWTSSLTDDALKDALQNLKPGSFADNLYLAADCREKASWLIRVNAGRALRLKYGTEEHVAGWEDTPLLAMICARYAEHYRFRSSSYRQVGITLGKDGLFRHFLSFDEFADEHTAARIYERLKKSRKVTIIQVKKKKHKESPPLLHNLASLQMEASRVYGLSAWETLAIAERLYAKKFITFPRTTCRYVTEAMLPAILSPALPLPGRLNRHSINDMKVNGHPALLVAGLKTGRLKDDERRIYNLIACRIAEAFAPDCRRETLTVEASSGDLFFTSSSSRITSPGWLAVHRSITGEKVVEDAPVPTFCEGEKVAVSAYNLPGKRTLPPPLFTEAALPAAMPRAGKGGIASLLEHGYVERSGQALTPTAKGLSFYNKVKYLRLSDAGRIDAWEKALNAIETDAADAAAFMHEVEMHTRLITHDILLKRTPGLCEL
jgi:DNA topoisomerase-3